MERFPRTPERLFLLGATAQPPDPGAHRSCWGQSPQLAPPTASGHCAGARGQHLQLRAAGLVRVGPRGGAAPLPRAGESGRSGSNKKRYACVVWGACVRVCVPQRKDLESPLGVCSWELQSSAPWILGIKETWSLEPLVPVRKWEQIFLPPCCVFVNRD